MNKVTKVVAILMTVAVVAMVFAFSNVFATGISLPVNSGNGVAATGTNTPAPTTPAPTAGARSAKTNTTNTTNTTKNTVANTNTINNNLVKDKEELPKTGEFDVYIISVVAVVVVLVGGFAFVKSRKIN